VLAAVGGSAHLFGASTGGALALGAAAAGVAAISVAAYDVPYSVTADAIRSWQTYVAALHTALAEDDRDRALELFIGVAGSPDEEICAGQGVTDLGDAAPAGPHPRLRRGMSERWFAAQ
jgi:hypothetical protein